MLKILVGFGTWSHRAEFDKARVAARLSSSADMANGKGGQFSGVVNQHALAEALGADRLNLTPDVETAEDRVRQLAAALERAMLVRGGHVTQADPARVGRRGADRLLH